MQEYVRFSKNKSVHKGITYIVDLLDFTLVCVFCFILVFAYVLTFAQVKGASMESTLCDGDRLLVLKLGNDYDCGDIIIANSHESVLLDENNEPYTVEGLEKVIIKRVIAVEGQTVDIDFETGVVYCDSQPLTEAYVKGETTTPTKDGAFEYPIVIPEGYLFVLGDNRAISKDSRYPDVGLVRVSDVIGRVLMRIAPFDALGLE